MIDYEITSQGNQLTIGLKGVIDDLFDPDAITNALRGRVGATITFDFTEVEGINSCGVRKWIKLAQTLPADAKYLFQGCRSGILDQFQMTPSFLPQNGVIASCYIDYVCIECDHEVSQFYGQVDTIEPLNCEKCDSTMEADVTTELSKLKRSA